MKDPTAVRLGAAGGTARARKYTRAEIAEQNAAGLFTKKPTKCAKCGKLQPTAVAARFHCRKKRSLVKS